MKITFWHAPLYLCAALAASSLNAPATLTTLQDAAVENSTNATASWSQLHTAHHHPMTFSSWQAVFEAAGR